MRSTWAKIERTTHVAIGRDWIQRSRASTATAIASPKSPATMASHEEWSGKANRDQTSVIDNEEITRQFQKQVI